MALVAMDPHRAPALSDGKSLALIKRTVAKDCNADEFEMFIGMARALRLDPLRRQIYAFVFSKNDEKKRRMSIIVGIDGFRTIAERTGNYRPDEDEPTYEYDASQKGPLNPAGLVKATVRVFKHSHGAWHKVTASAFWTEYAPLKDEWAEGDDGKRRPTGKQTLDTSGNWGRMPRLMLAKVAEALALRKAWPDDFSNVYGEEEVDRALAQDMSAAELIQHAEEERRLQAIGANGVHITLSFNADDPLEGVPVGNVYDRVMAWVNDKCDGPADLKSFQIRNQQGLREYWAHAKSDALALKKEFEARLASMMKDDPASLMSAG